MWMCNSWHLCCCCDAGPSFHHFQLDPNVRVFNFLQLVWGMFTNPAVLGIFHHPEEHVSFNQTHEPLSQKWIWEVFRLTGFKDRKQRLFAVWRRGCYSSMARVCFSLRVWSLVWAEVRLAAHTAGTAAHVAPITLNH